MKKELRNLSRTKAKERIDEFFQCSSFSADEVKKIKRLVMKYNIKLGSYRRLFCKKCLSELRGKIRIKKTHKMVICEKCKYGNKFRLD